MKQLHDELRLRRLPVSGKKEVLIARLEEYEGMTRGETNTESESDSGVSNGTIPAKQGTAEGLSKMWIRALPISHDSGIFAASINRDWASSEELLRRFGGYPPSGTRATAKWSIYLELAIYYSQVSGAIYKR